jgi:uncharacterized protein YycO
MKRTPLLQTILWLCLPFSRVINLINWRFGRSYGCNSLETDYIKKHLQPGMIILTHRNYECSSIFIPGYWTHVAIVSASGNIIDATRKGVCISSIESFFSTIDDFIILKPSFCCQEMMTNAGSLASNLIGYPFCFNFLNSNKTFYCSGLVCWVYTQIVQLANPEIKPYPIISYLNGNIIKPEDFIRYNSFWKVVHRLN